MKSKKIKNKNNFKEFSTETNQEKKYEAFFKEVVIRTAKLVAHWQSCGFVHG